MVSLTFVFRGKDYINLYNNLSDHNPTCSISSYYLVILSSPFILVFFFFFLIFCWSLVTQPWVIFNHSFFTLLSVSGAPPAPRILSYRLWEFRGQYFLFFFLSLYVCRPSFKLVFRSHPPFVWFGSPFITMLSSPSTCFQNPRKMGLFIFYLGSPGSCLLFPPARFLGLPWCFS